MFKFDGKVLTESLAIIEFLDERFPATSLLPFDGYDRAHARAIAHLVELALLLKPSLRWQAKFSRCKQVVS